MPVQRVASTSIYAPTIGFSSAVRAGDLIFVSGMTAVDAEGAVVGGTDAYEQARECFAKIARTLGELDARLDQIVQTRMYLTDASSWQDVGRAHGEALGAHRPAATMVVTALLDPRMLIEVEVVAYVGT